MKQPNPIFVHQDPLIAGSYLLGDYAWNEAMRLESAVLIGRPPQAGVVRIALEVAGVITDKEFTLGASGLGELRQNLALGVRLAAGQSLRFKVVEFAGDAEMTAADVAITLNVTREVDAVVADQRMSVWWREGQERLRLFRYEPETHAYSEVNPVLAAPRASITVGGTFRIVIRGEEVLRVASDTLYTAALVAGGLARALQPQLEFYVGHKPIATLTYAGVLHVPAAAQLAPVDQLNQFWLGSGAALNAAGVVAATFEQPL